MSDQNSRNASNTTRRLAVLRGGRIRRIALWLGGLLLGFGVLGYFAAPPLLKWLLEKQLTTALHRQVSIEQIRNIVLVIANPRHRDPRPLQANLVDDDAELEDRE